MKFIKDFFFIVVVCYDVNNYILPANVNVKSDMRTTFIKDLSY